MAISAVNWRGAWNSGATYQVNDITFSGGSAWIARRPSINQEPASDSFYWSLFASAGAPGATGPAGPPGSSGQGFAWRGAYATNTVYDAYDCVSFDNATYVCLTNNVSNIDPVTGLGTSWNQMAAVTQVNADWNASSGAAAILNKPSLTQLPAAVGLGTPAVAGQAMTLSATTPVITTPGTSLTLQQTGDTYGSTTLLLENRNGMNGAKFTNGGMALVDFAFSNTSSNQFNIRYECRNGSQANPGNTTGEFQFLDMGSGKGIATFGKAAILLAPALVSGWTSTVQVGIGTNSPGSLLDLNGSTTATSSANGSSASFRITGSYWTGSAAAADYWSMQNLLGSGANPSSTLSITHAGSTGTALVSVPNLSVGASPAKSGLIRVPGNTVLNYRNYAGTADLNAIQFGSGATSDSLVIGNSGIGIYINSGGITNWANFNTRNGAAATSTQNNSSPQNQFTATYWNGTASANDIWTTQANVGSGANPTSTLSFTHSGTTGAAAVAVPHLAGNTGAPSIAAGAGAGTTPTVSMQSGSTDLSGWVNVTTGTSPTSGAVVATITFNQPYNAATKVILTPANANAAALYGGQQVYVPIPGGGTSFVIESGATALAASTAYQWTYTVTQ